jgi:phosphocarrier protein
VTSERVTIVNSLGLHARAASRFVGLASRFRSRVRVSVGERTTEGKSILGLLLLVAARGTELTIAAEGPDEAVAVAALADFTRRGFEER